MIGVLKSDYIFEFRDEPDLAFSISQFIKKYDNYEVGFILNESKKLIGVLSKGEFTLQPTNTSEETKYYVFCPKPYNLSFYENVDKGSDINTNDDGDLFVFYYVNYRIPKQLNLF